MASPSSARPTDEGSSPPEESSPPAPPTESPETPPPPPESSPPAPPPDSPETPPPPPESSPPAPPPSTDSPETPPSPPESSPPAPSPQTDSPTPPPPENSPPSVPTPPPAETPTPPAQPPATPAPGGSPTPVSPRAPSLSPGRSPYATTAAPRVDSPLPRTSSPNPSGHAISPSPQYNPMGDGPPPPLSNSKTTIIAAAVGGALGFLLLFALFCYLYPRKRKENQRSRLPSTSEEPKKGQPQNPAAASGGRGGGGGGGTSNAVKTPERPLMTEPQEARAPPRMPPSYVSYNRYEENVMAIHQGSTVARLQVDEQGSWFQQSQAEGGHEGTSSARLDKDIKRLHVSPPAPNQTLDPDGSSFSSNRKHVFRPEREHEDKGHDHVFQSLSNKTLASASDEPRKKLPQNTPAARGGSTSIAVSTPERLLMAEPQEERAPLRMPASNVSTVARLDVYEQGRLQQSKVEGGQATSARLDKDGNRLQLSPPAPNKTLDSDGSAIASNRKQVFHEDNKAHHHVFKSMPNETSGSSSDGTKANDAKLSVPLEKFEPERATSTSHSLGR